MTTSTNKRTAYRPTGFSSLIPLLVVSPASEAIAFYQAVLGATVTTRMEGPDGSVWHCELQLESGRLQVMDPNEQFHTVPSDPASDNVSFSIAAYVPDVEAATAAARERGARVREEPDDFEVTGDRFASVQDPYGVRWTLMCRTVPRTDREIQQGLDAWQGSMG